MTTLKIFLALSLCSLAACTAKASETPNENTAETEEELRSAECPPALDVLLMKPSIMTDAKLLSTWTDDLDSATDAQEQMTRLESHVTTARAQNAVKLHGTIGRACAYKTVDAQTGEPNGYRFWLAKSYGGANAQLQLRIERDLGDDNALFFKVPLTEVTKTSIEVDTTKKGSAYAQIHEFGYHGEPDGPNAWIGGAKATVTLAQSN